MPNTNTTLRKIIIWSLVFACYLSFGSGYGRTIICSDHQDEITFDRLYSGSVKPCPVDSRQGHQHTNRIQKNKTIAQIPLENKCCATCDYVEISRPLFAPRNEPSKTIINFITKPLFPPVISGNLYITSPALSAQLPDPPSVQNPSFTCLKSTVLLI